MPKSTNQKKRKIACLNCRRKKVCQLSALPVSNSTQPGDHSNSHKKCDLQTPCKQCQKSQSDCLYPEQDGRSQRLAASKSVQLERKIKVLEKFVKELSDVRSKFGDDGNPKLVFGLIDEFVKRGMSEGAEDDKIEEDGKTHVKVEANDNDVSGIGSSSSSSLATGYTKKKADGGKVIPEDTDKTEEETEDTESNEELAQNQFNSVMIKSTGQKS
ncbi:unnamed protein product, partial [Ambrosiozyma monospora]